MAVFRNDDLRFSPPVNPRQQGETITVMASYTITENIANGDVVEMGALPAGCRLVDFRTQRTNTNPSANLNFGIIDGDYLGNANDRDIPNTNRVIANTPESSLQAEATVADLINQGADDNNTRGIGFEVLSNQTGSNGGTVYVIYQYMAVGNA